MFQKYLILHDFDIFYETFTLIVKYQINLNQYHDKVYSHTQLHTSTKF
jgi:hypothetical protein